MSDRYQLHLDIPYDVLVEEGYDKSRLCRDLRTGRSLQIGSNCMLEPKTGTLMLRPLNMDPVAWFSSSTDSLRLHQANLDFIAGAWHEHPEVLPSGSGTHSIMSTGGTGFTLVQLLNTIAVASLTSAVLQAGRTLVPVIASTASYPINQGYHIRIYSMTYPGAAARDYLSFMFGDFMFTMHTDGGAELWWSTDGTWKHVKEFTKLGDPKGMTTSIIGFAPNAALDLYVIPFGRGNILFMLKSGGKTFHDVYTHHEAVWSTSEGRYQITKAGKFGVYVNGNDAHAVKLSVSLIGYPNSGNYTGDQDVVPYFPTAAPLLSTFWTKTTGSPSVIAQVLDASGDAWVSNGTHRTFKVRLSLAGDGSCTPWVDGYHLVFPEVIEHRTPTPIAVPQDKILSLRIEDGKDWDQQGMTAEILDDFTDEAISSLTWRSRINGKLTIDGEDFARVMFETPKTIRGPKMGKITLTGVNYGVFRMTKKRFTFSNSYGNVPVDEALKLVLMKAGFPLSVISTGECSTLLPESSLQGQDTDDPQEKDAPQFKSQPEPNTSLREFFEYILANFSPRWRARYKANGVWDVDADEIPATSQGTLTQNPTLDQVMANSVPWMSKDYEIEVGPPECNSLLVIGKTDKGEVIGNEALNEISVSTSEDPKPLSYIGEIDQALRIDFSLNTQEVLDVCLQAMAEEGFRPYATVTWRGPLNKDLAVGTRWTIPDLCDVVIESLSSDAGSIKILETTESTTYVGRIVTE